MCVCACARVSAYACAAVCVCALVCMCGVSAGEDGMGGGSSWQTACDHFHIQEKAGTCQYETEVKQWGKRV